MIVFRIENQCYKVNKIWNTRYISRKHPNCQRHPYDRTKPSLQSLIISRLVVYVLTLEPVLAQNPPVARGHKTTLNYPSNVSKTAYAQYDPRSLFDSPEYSPIKLQTCPDDDCQIGVKLLYYINKRICNEQCLPD